MTTAVSHKVSELIGDDLDYWAAMADVDDFPIKPYEIPDLAEWWKPSTNWSQGGPLIEKHLVVFDVVTGEDCDAIKAYCSRLIDGVFYDHVGVGIESLEEDNAYLISAMRCIVASVYGDEVKDERT